LLQVVLVGKATRGPATLSSRLTMPLRPGTWCLSSPRLNRLSTPSSRSSLVSVVEVVVGAVWEVGEAVVEEDMEGVEVVEDGELGIPVLHFHDN